MKPYQLITIEEQRTVWVPVVVPKRLADALMKRRVILLHVLEPELVIDLDQDAPASYPQRQTAKEGL